MSSSNDPFQGFTLSIVDAYSSEEASVVWEGLEDHAIERTGRPAAQALSIFLKDAIGRVVAGMLGWHGNDWLEIRGLWVDAALRGRGIGSALLALAENKAVALGLHHAHLDTYEFQALPFYLKHGYSVFAELDDYPPGMKRYYLKKRVA
jgi:GNAT superfamily N-acetyltransferase